MALIVLPAMALGIGLPLWMLLATHYTPREGEHFVEELSRLRAQQQRGLGLER